MIPNRDSIPQNHPRPKDAVSKTDGAAASMAGIAGDSGAILYARFISFSVFFDSWPARESIVGEQAHRTKSILSKHKHQVAPVQHLFFIDIPFLNFRPSSPFKRGKKRTCIQPVQFNDNHQLTGFCKDSIKIGRSRMKLPAADMPGR
jgi:hypothetical protein